MKTAMLFSDIMRNNYGTILEWNRRIIRLSINQQQKGEGVVKVMKV